MDCFVGFFWLVGCFFKEKKNTSAAALVLLFSITYQEKHRTIRKDPEERKKMTLGIEYMAKDLEII